MKDVSESVINMESDSWPCLFWVWISAEKISVSTGTVARGVSDLWDNDAGEVKFSPYFFHRVAQLAMKSNAEANSS